MKTFCINWFQKLPPLVKRLTKKVNLCRVLFNKLISSELQVILVRNYLYM